ncbi:MAG: hypothetical protein A3C35_08485 [Omnitrophica bacterium RIFCSPHIGHO2_02_FULL_46_11]|nr:MAG: hypothetical protein A3C35_08485 [Omnitrophica bacterium RIFCSPHIGHO2_02_FULL_46_11]OGW87814.1 MAG: hypothetical protein A3A81_01840 [Omnitrophica bacterium RIFCSPLOWO2_01_FULL_45_10b]
MPHLGKLFIIFGASLILIGILFQFVGKLPGIGRLPGDIYIRKGPVTFYFPIVTSLAMSLILSLLVSFFWRK